MSSDKTDRRARAEQMRKERERADKRRRNGITAAIVAVVLVLIAVATFGIYQATKDNEVAAGAMPDGATEDFGFVVDQEALAGESTNDDPVDVVLYEDFQCPGCKAFEASVRTDLEELISDGTMQVEFRPIDFIDDLTGGGTDYSLRTANASACVYDKGGAKAFFEFHQPVYDNQMPEGSEGIPDEQLVSYANAAGADGVTSCIEDGAYEGLIEKSKQKWAEDGHNGTPVVIIEGEVLEGATDGTLPTAEEFRAAVEEAANA